jgi:dimethylglycine dehydrogenase
MIEATDADVLGDEPIWAKVGDVDHGTVEAPHGHGATRFDAKGREMPRPDPVRDGDWRVVGWVTSGGYAHWVQASMAQGYLPADLAERGEAGLFAVEIMGERRAARIALEPPFDPAGERMRM